MESLTYLMRDYLYNVDEKTRVQRKKLVVQKVYDKAMSGDEKAMDRIWHYIEGKPKENHEHNHTGNINVIIKKK